MIAAVAAKIGMKYVLIQESWVPHEDRCMTGRQHPAVPHHGAETQLVDKGFDIGIRASWTRALEEVEARGGKPYAIPAGASSTNSAAWDMWALRRKSGAGAGNGRPVRLRDHLPVTGSTHARMVVGFAADRRQRKVIGMMSCAPNQTKAQVLDIAQKTSELIGGKPISSDDYRAERGLPLPCYGMPTKETVEAIRLSARLEGMITDPVYEGKSMQGMIDLVQKGFFPKGSKVLYAHLGGGPALNGYSYTFRNG